MITKLDQLIEAVVERGKRTVAVAYAEDAHTLGAVNEAVELGIIDAILIGDPNDIAAVARQKNIDLSRFRIVEQKSAEECVNRAIELINAGEADILMKGLISTDKYMRGILSRENCLVPPKTILSHIVVLELAAYHKLLVITDVAVIPAPDIAQKTAMTKYVIDVAQKLGVENPKVAIIAPTEQVLAGMPSCTEAAIIAKMADRGQFPSAIVDGPLALDVALDPETVRIKKLDSPVKGDADCLVFPNIESANVFFKSATKLMDASLAAMVMGAKVPCVLTSRGDSEKSKLYSIALAALTAK